MHRFGPRQRAVLSAPINEPRILGKFSFSLSLQRFKSATKCDLPKSDKNLEKARVSLFAIFEVDLEELDMALDTF